MHEQLSVKRTPILIGLAVAVIAFLSVSYLGLSEQARYENAATNRATKYAEYTRNEITETCRVVPLIEVAKCLDKARAEAALKQADNQRNEADLVAQRTSALWTMVMGISAVFGVASGSIGILLLWLAYRQSRLSNIIAMADRRPSLYADTVSYRLRLETVKAEIGIKNYGQSEACDVAFSAAVSFGPHPLLKRPPPLQTKAGPSGKLHMGQSRWQYVDKKFGKYKAQIEAEQVALIITGHVSYTDQFGRSYSDRFDYFSTGKDFFAGVLRVCDPWEEPEEMHEGDVSEAQQG